MTDRSTDMLCRECGEPEVHVYNSRVVYDGRMKGLSEYPTVRRARKCRACGARWHTVEFEIEELLRLRERAELIAETRIRERIKAIQRAVMEL